VDHVGRLLIGMGRQIREYGARIEQHEVNGQPGAMILDAEGELVSVLSLEIVDDTVRRVRGVINPDKLHHLGPVADVWALLQQGP
jgi:RNA polymerase sigma-70 factor, ECF subfamily